jgi:hypothetical protein
VSHTKSGGSSSKAPPKNTSPKKQKNGFQSDNYPIRHYIDVVILYNSENKAITNRVRVKPPHGFSTQRSSTGWRAEEPRDGSC